MKITLSDHHSVNVFPCLRSNGGSNENRKKAKQHRMYIEQVILCLLHMRRRSPLSHRPLRLKVPLDDSNDCTNTPNLMCFQPMIGNLIMTTTNSTLNPVVNEILETPGGLVAIPRGLVYAIRLRSGPHHKFVSPALSL